MARPSAWALGLLLSLQTVGSASAQGAGEPLLWVVGEFAPATIKDGPQRGQGFVERLLHEILIPGLPGWQHQAQLAPTARVLRDLETLPQACTPGLAHSPQRAERLLFSVPVMRFLPVGLVVRRSSLPGLAALREADGAISLQRYLAGEQHRLGVMGQRTHGAAVDALLAQRPQRLTAINFGNSTQSLLAMLAQQRDIDATFAFDLELAHFERVQPRWRGQLVWLPLREQPLTVSGHIACARSPAGAKVIAAVNALLLRPGVRERAQSFYEGWLAPNLAAQLQQMRRGAPEPQSFWDPGPAARR